MTASLSGVFSIQEFTDAGVLLVGGRVYTYTAGTTTQKVAYTDAAGAVPQTYTADGLGGQYIALNARGELPAPLYLTTGSYDIALKRADGSTVWTRRADPVGDSGNSFIASLAASAGAALIGFIQSGAGAVLRLVQDKLRELVSTTDFGAVANGSSDDTTAATAAQTAAPYVYVPAGKALYTFSAVSYQQFFGHGTMRMGSSTINLPPFPKTGGLICGYNPLSFGSYENAVAGAFTINSANGQLKNNVQVNGTSGSGYATPQGQQRDHVALFFLAAPPTAIVPGASSTYTATTLTATEIGAAGAGAILPGMIADTKHGTPYSGTVLSRSGSTITVDSWWLNGGSPTAGTPANGTGATINPTTVTFAANGVVSTTSTGTDAASGLEMDVFCLNSVGANASTAFDAVGLGTFTALAGYRARGNLQIGCYVQGTGVAVGFIADATVGGYEARNVTGLGFYSRVSGVIKWAVNSIGNVAQDFRNTVINASATYAFTASDVVVVNVSGGAVLTLPAVTGQAGRTITVNASSGCTVKNQAATTIKTLIGGTSAVFSCDGSFWY